jgi:transcriptional regulator with XRE-family HTH domain
MKQVELAKKLGISKSYMSMILSGKRRLKPELLCELSSQDLPNFEAISSLRGRRPRPLDECASRHYSTKRSVYITNHRLIRY